jgi:hypothetical protein
MATKSMGALKNDSRSPCPSGAAPLRCTSRGAKALNLIGTAGRQIRISGGVGPGRLVSPGPD